MQINLKI